VTFGPVGRVVATVLILAPVVFGVFVSVFFLVAAAFWACVVPFALRDVWRRTRVGSQAVPDLVASSAAHSNEDPICARVPPRRW